MFSANYSSQLLKDYGLKKSAFNELDQFKMKENA